MKYFKRWAKYDFEICEENKILCQKLHKFIKENFNDVQKLFSNQISLLKMIMNRGLLLLLLITFFIFLSHGEPQQRRRHRQQRRRRILNMLETYQGATVPTYRAARFDFSRRRTGVGGNQTIQHYQSGWSGRTPDPLRTTPPPTIEPPASPYDLWYYKDDSNYIQGPFSSPTMLEWQRAGYFRQGLLLRREVDNIFSNLATYTSLYGRSPFTPGHYPRSIIVRTTTIRTTTTTTTTTTSTTLSTSTTTLPPFNWQRFDTSQVLTPNRGDDIDIEEDDENYSEENVEMLETDNDATEPKEGSLRLVGGHDETEVYMLTS